MAKINNARVSIVIPVYNEADRLEACLLAIGRQTMKPYEVIVVDNNSTDSTAQIAANFDFVCLMTEKKQGVTHARTRGFDAARGDIIGRIDADTLIPVDWVTQVQHLFADPELSAVSGSADYYDFILAPLVNAVDRRCRTYLAMALHGQLYLWGANMALRRSAWHDVKASLCVQAGLHEDFDLGIHLQRSGHKVGYAERLMASVSLRRIDTSFTAYVQYCLVCPQTYKHHGIKARFYMYPVLVLCWVTYLPGRLLYRAYDSDRRSFSYEKLLSAATARVDPSSNIV